MVEDYPESEMVVLDLIGQYHKETELHLYETVEKNKNKKNKNN